MQVRKTTLVVLSLREAYAAFEQKAVDIRVYLEPKACQEMLMKTIKTVMNQDDCIYSGGRETAVAINFLEQLGFTDIEAYELILNLFTDIEKSIMALMPDYEFDAPFGAREFSMRNPYDLVIAFFPLKPEPRSLHVSSAK